MDINHKKSLEKFIYLDNNATSIVHPEVKKFLSVLDNIPFNPSSPHSLGLTGFAIIEEARSKILDMLKLDKKTYEVVFTSSGTEANNLLINSFIEGKILISSIEHPSIVAFTEKNHTISSVKIDHNGYLDINDLEYQLQNTPRTINKRLLSVIYAHNETGVIQKNIQDITQLAHKFNFLVHSDMSQCPGRTNWINLNHLDYITLSSHKIGGPIGVGALIKRIKTPISPIIIGGGQENNIRSGTENVLAIAGFGEIAKIILYNSSDMIEKLTYLRNCLENKLTSKLPHIKIIHQNSMRLSNTSLFINQKKTSEMQIIEMDLEQIAISNGSACSAKKKQFQNIMYNIGYDSQTALSAIRISLSIHNNLQDIEIFLEKYFAKNAL